jgi:hypothetical protein
MIKTITISFILTDPFANINAFVGVATGSIKAKLTDNIRGRSKYGGLIFISCALK